MNAKTIEDIVKSVSIPVQLGGGIRTLDNIKDVMLDLGFIVLLLEQRLSQIQTLSKRQSINLVQNISLLALMQKDGFVAVEGWEN